MKLKLKIISKFNKKDDIKYKLYIEERKGKQKVGKKELIYIFYYYSWVI